MLTPDQYVELRRRAFSILSGMMGDLVSCAVVHGFQEEAPLADLALAIWMYEWINRQYEDKDGIREAFKLVSFHQEKPEIINFQEVLRVIA